MKKNTKQLLEETQVLQVKNKELHQLLKQHMQKAKDTIELIKIGQVDALVLPDKNGLKIYTEKTADKTYRILIEKMHEGAVTINKDGIILYCNSSFADMVNQPLQKVIGSRFENFIENASKKLFKTLEKKGWDGYASEELSLVANVGKIIPALLSITSLKIDDKIILSVIITDISVRHKIQGELIQTTKQLEQKNIELEKANQELAFQNKEKEKRAAELSIANKELAIQNIEKEKRARELSIANKDLTTLTFVSSHDLQEPLRKIKNFASVLLEEETKKLSDDGKKYLQRIYESANGMQTLIEDLLVYARSKDTEGEFKKTKLSTIVEEVKQSFEELIREKKAIIEVHQLCETKIIWFQFRQLMYNLISNSLKFSKPGIAPHIIIKSEIKHGNKLKNKKLARNIDYCHISFTDNGIGFDPQYNDRIFGVFQRLHSKEEYMGTGIGLAIVKRIVENHKGIITATGKLNKGARFDIYLPVL